MIDEPHRHLHLVEDRPEPPVRLIDSFADTVDALLTVDVDLPIGLNGLISTLLIKKQAGLETDREHTFELWVALSAAAGQSTWWRGRWRAVAQECGDGS